MNEFEPFEGGCDCRLIRFRCLAPPLIVHGCHCRWCQRESGSAFAINAMLESEHLVLVQGEPEAVLTPSESGKGQTIMRCPVCRLALWSHYPGGGKKVASIRVGTLDQPDQYPPDVHIYTSSKQPWVVLPEGASVWNEFYAFDQVWSPESLQRLAQLRAKKA